MRVFAVALSVLSILFVLPSSGLAETRLTVMSYNVYGGGANDKKPIDETVAVIKAVGADIIGIQETRLEGKPCNVYVCPPAGVSVAKAIADALGFYYYDQTKENVAIWANAVISRYPILGATPNDLGVRIDVQGRTVYAFNLHLDDAPYQPYQLVGIRYGKYPFLKREPQAIRWARRTRGPAIKLWKKDLRKARKADAAFVFGDFNEPSHRDWTQAAARIGRHPIKVAYPTTRAVETKGFVDTYRAVFPDEVAKPGFTWTPTTGPHNKYDHHDRIDFAFARAKNLVVESAGIVGEMEPWADIVVTPWPSDHRASVATVRF